MGTKLPPLQLKLYQGIDEILFNDWDPIGIKRLSGPRDEYYSYIPQVFKLAMEDTDPSRVAKYLTEVAHDSMGLSPSLQKDIAVSEKIMQLKKSLGL